MRRLFLTLLFANIAFFAFTRLYSGTAMPARQPVAKVDPKPVSQVDPQPVRAPSAAVVTSAVEPARPSAPEPATTPMCLEWAGIAAEDLEPSRLLLDSVDASYEVIAGGDPAQPFWVRIPGLNSRAAVDDMADQLRAAGHTDFAVTRDAEQDTYAISLGVFRSEANAMRLQTQVQHLGAVITATGAEPTTYLVRRGADRVSERITAAASQFRDTVTREVTCPESAAAYGT